MYVDCEQLEDEFRQYVGSSTSTMTYVEEALNLFPTDPVISEKSDGILHWPHKGFVASPAVTRRTDRSTYGYNPLTCMLIALDRLEDNGQKTVVVYDRWTKECGTADDPNGKKKFRLALLEKLFVEGVPATNVECFTTVEATDVMRIRIALIGTGRCIRDIAPSYRWLKNTYDCWLGTLRLYSEAENRLVEACQKAAGIKRRARRCNETITVKCEPRKWLYDWSDCTLITFGNNGTYYERRDERLKWISILIWEFICNKLHKDNLPLCLLLSFDHKNL